MKINKAVFLYSIYFPSIKTIMFISEIMPDQVPLKLLLEADPDPEKISDYLSKSMVYAVIQQKNIIAICVILPKNDSVFELMNIAAHREHQAKGIGNKLLNHVIATIKAMNAEKIVVGTGSFGYQLAFYQKAGFRVQSVDHDFFLNNYAEPVFESGIQHKDRLILELIF